MAREQLHPRILGAPVVTKLTYLQTLNVVGACRAVLQSAVASGNPDTIVRARDLEEGMNQLARDADAARAKAEKELAEGDNNDRG